MMPTCRYVLAIAWFVLVSASAWADTNPAMEFLTQRGISQNQSATIVDSTESYKGCLSSSDYIVCLLKERYPKLHNNPTAIAALASGNSMRVKNMLHGELERLYQPSADKDKSLAKASLRMVMTSHNNLVPSQFTEFASYRQHDWLINLAAIRLSYIARILDIYSTHKDFTENYCRGLYSKAKSLVDNGKYQNSLEVLKEIHDLKCADISAYITVVKAFLKAGQRSDADKLASVILSDFGKTMSSLQAESLGDIFLSLGNSNSAETAFNIAIRKNMNSGQ